MTSSLAKVDETRLLEGELSVKSTIKLPSPKSRRIWKDFHAGQTKQQIAQQLNMDARAVSKAIRVVDKWLASAVTIDLVGYKVKSHAEYENIYRQAMMGYHGSGGERRKIVRRFGQNPQDPTSKERVIIEETETIEHISRDPKFLMVAMKAKAEQREMLPGANAPKATSLTNQQGTDDARLQIDMRGLVATLSERSTEAMLEAAASARAAIEAQASQ